MELLRGADFRRFGADGIVSIQLVSPHNSQSERVTITRVTVEPGAVQPRHSHEAAEQIWVAEKGSGVLLLAEGEEREFVAGAVARFCEGDIHGLRNAGPEPFVYTSVTSPPMDFSSAYPRRGDKE